MNPSLVGIPVHDARVSPVFDVARQLALFTWSNADACYHLERTCDLEQFDGRARVERLRGLSLQTLICGAISRGLLDALMAAGIHVVPLITGPIDTVIVAFAANRLIDDHCWHMPGSPHCQRRRQRGCGRQQGGGPTPSHKRQYRRLP